MPYPNRNPKGYNAAMFRTIGASGIDRMNFINSLNKADTIAALRVAARLVNADYKRLSAIHQTPATRGLIRSLGLPTGFKGSPISYAAWQPLSDLKSTLTSALTYLGSSTGTVSGYKAWKQKTAQTLDAGGDFDGFLSGLSDSEKYDIWAAIDILRQTPEYNAWRMRQVDSTGFFSGVTALFAASGFDVDKVLDYLANLQEQSYKSGSASAYLTQISTRTGPKIVK